MIRQIAMSSSTTETLAVFICEGRIDFSIKRSVRISPGGVSMTLIPVKTKDLTNHIVKRASEIESQCV